MIYTIYSSLPTFKSLEFMPGLNVLIAQKEIDSSEKHTRNRAGKTSLIEIIHFLMGADVPKDSLFRAKQLANHSFNITFDLANEKTTAERSCKEPSKTSISSSKLKKNIISKKEWLNILGKEMFHLSNDENNNPSFRSLFSYFVRRQNSGGLVSPEKNANMQQPSDYQKSLMYLMGFDWKIERDWQLVRNREKTLKELKKATKKGAFGMFIGKASELRTQLTIQEARLQDLKKQLSKFHVLPTYRSLEKESDQITLELNTLSNKNTIDIALVRELENTLKKETPPSFDALENIYAEAGVILSNSITKRYEEVESFHKSIIRNRQDYLLGELSSAKDRVEQREQKKIKLDERRSEILSILQSHGALDQFSKLQGEVNKLEVEVESLRQKFNAAEELEGTKNELEIERGQLTLRLRRDLSEQKQLLTEAILAFEETSKYLYESAGSFAIEETSNGPMFSFPMQGSRSKGIKNMQIFCFDFMLMRLCAKREMGPRFLVHDSHLFDGVDGRQVISALKVGSETAKEFGFQYIVTLNEDDAFKEKIPGFNIEDYIIPVRLSDLTDDGGLFGTRF
ncbi:TPA: ABC-three component system protein [Legionella pneumophila]